MFDFDQPTDRRLSGSYKWDSTHGNETRPDDILPLWVADMDFKTAPCIIDALRRRVDHGIFGYTHVGEDYYDALNHWFSTRHGLRIKREDVIYTSGVVPAISAIIKALTAPGDHVIVQTPVYNCFFSSIRNNKCLQIDNPLIYSNKTYHIDFDDFERKAADPKAKVFLLCNPHNPAGRVWKREELTRLGEICHRHNVVVVADEIHCELVYSPYRYTPFASINEEFRNRSITCLSPSKAFNTAGLQIANIVVPDEKMRRLVDRAINDNEVCDVNPFGPVGLIAAYNEGLPWLETLIAYLYDNYLALCSFIEKELPSIDVVTLEGTYLAWLDCRRLGMTSEEIERRALEKGHVWVNGGSIYGAAGEGFIRINLATQRSRLLEGLRRFALAIK